MRLVTTNDQGLRYEDEVCAGCLARVGTRHAPSCPSLARVRALLVAMTRAAGASHRRIAELQGERTQAEGARLVADAERVLGLPPGALDDSDLWLAVEDRLRALGWSDQPMIPARREPAT